MSRTVRALLVVLTAGAILAISGCSQNFEPTSSAEIVSALSKAGINCAAEGADPSPTANSELSQTTCGTLNIWWFNDTSQDSVSQVCKRLGITSATSAQFASDPEVAKIAAVFGKNWFVDSSKGSDFGGINPQDIAKALPGSQLLSGTEVIEKCP